MKIVIFRDFGPISGFYTPENGRLILQCSIFQKSSLRSLFFLEFWDYVD